MSNDIQTNIEELFNAYLQEGGKPAVTHFRQFLNKHIDAIVKPMCKGSGKAGSNLEPWKGELKARFGGRGAKWVKVSIDEVKGSIERIATEEGVDMGNYVSWINKAGFAWIRFDGPRTHEGKKCAAFKILSEGSTFMQSGRLHYIEVSRLDDVITPLGGTPHAMKLEEKVMEEAVEVVVEDDVEVNVVEEVVENEDMMGDIEALMAEEDDDDGLFAAF